MDVTPCPGIACVDSMYTWLAKLDSNQYDNSDAATRVADPILMVGIAVHSIGLPSSSKTNAPVAPGSIPMILILVAPK